MIPDIKREIAKPILNIVIRALLLFSPNSSITAP
jgi:hypothetical protein